MTWNAMERHKVWDINRLIAFLLPLTIAKNPIIVTTTSCSTRARVSQSRTEHHPNAWSLRDDLRLLLAHYDHHAMWRAQFSPHNLSANVIFARKLNEKRKRRLKTDFEATKRVRITVNYSKLLSIPFNLPSISAAAAGMGSPYIYSRHSREAMRS